jgi:hypothetical protein
MKAIYDIEVMPITGGFKYGELVILAAGRQTGKTMLNQMFGSMMKPVTKFEINAKAEVDGATWYTVSCTKDISEWLRTQPKELRYEALAHGWVLSQFDIHEKLYTMLALKWS